VTETIKGLVLEVEDTTATPAQQERFLKLSGYKKEDILGSNRTGVFVTDNGGKYSMDKAGKTLTTKAGPAYPNQEPEEADEE